MKYRVKVVFCHSLWLSTLLLRESERRWTSQSIISFHYISINLNSFDISQHLFDWSFQVLWEYLVESLLMFDKTRDGFFEHLITSRIVFQIAQFSCHSKTFFLCLLSCNNKSERQFKWFWVSSCLFVSSELNFLLSNFLVNIVSALLVFLLFLLCHKMVSWSCRVKCFLLLDQFTLSWNSGSA